MLEAVAVAQVGDAPSGIRSSESHGCHQCGPQTSTLAACQTQPDLLDQIHSFKTPRWPHRLRSLRSTMFKSTEHTSSRVTVLVHSTHIWDRLGQLHVGVPTATGRESHTRLARVHLNTGFTLENRGLVQ